MMPIALFAAVSLVAVVAVEFEEIEVNAVKSNPKAHVVIPQNILKIDQNSATEVLASILDQSKRSELIPMADNYFRSSVTEKKKTKKNPNSAETPKITYSSDKENSTDWIK